MNEENEEGHFPNFPFPSPLLYNNIISVVLQKPPKAKLFIRYSKPVFPSSKKNRATPSSFLIEKGLSLLPFFLLLSSILCSRATAEDRRKGRGKSKPSLFFFINLILLQPPVDGFPVNACKLCCFGDVPVASFKKVNQVFLFKGFKPLFLCLFEFNA